jgi:hypothetical protein
MALFDAVLKQVSKNADKVGVEQETTTNKLKSKAALIISLFAAIYSVDAFIGSQISSKILNNTIHVSDVWNFYQAKSIKQNLAEMQLDDAIERKDDKRSAELKAKIARYETDPVSGEGRRELLTKAKGIEAEIAHLKLQSPWVGLAGSIMQIAIVLITASMLSAGALMFWGGIGTMIFAIGLMLQGIFLWF